MHQPGRFHLQNDPSLSFQKNQYSGPQLEIIAGTESRKQVVAAAGSGKTRTVIGLVHFRLGQGLEAPGKVLLLTFSRKAAKEMKERLPAFCREAVEISTFHSFCYRHIASKHPDRSPGKITIIEEEEKNAFLAEQLKQYENEIGGIPFELLIAKDELFRELFPSIAMKVFRAFYAYKRLTGKTEYEDLIEIMLSDLSCGKDWAMRLKTNYDFILVDEFQDTDPRQLEFLKCMDPKRLVVVGDDWQSIYGFRGADVRPFLNFPKIFKGTKRFDLAENYRSLKNIVTAGNAVIRNSSKQIRKKVTAVRGKGPGFANLSVEIAAGSEERLVQILEHSEFMILTRSNFRLRRWIRAGVSEQQCMTIHKSKGLEFPVVLLDITGGWGGEESALLTDEEIRVAYVAVTRAENLFCCITASQYSQDSTERIIYEKLFENVCCPVHPYRLAEYLKMEKNYREEK